MAASAFEISRKVSKMIKLKDLTAVLRLVSLVLVLAFVVSATAVSLQPTGARAGDGTWQDLVLLYTTDIKGKIEPCG
jgi:hypothetical protein